MSVRGARAVGLCAGVALAFAGPVAAEPETPKNDPFFGEALFHAHQEQYFDALERLDCEIAQHYGGGIRVLPSPFGRGTCFEARVASGRLS